MNGRDRDRDRDRDRVVGFTSTGSKRPEALYDVADPGSGVPVRMVGSSGCYVWDERGREYVDFIMALGAVALGYAHPDVTAAAETAVRAGVVGSLAPVLEEEVAGELCRLVPWIERVRFLKSGAEAMAAAVRLARATTGRELVLGCGYHGWLDWCQATDPAVPGAVRALYAELPFNDAGRTRAMIRAAGDRLAAVAFEPIVVEEPTREWLEVIQEETRRAGAVLICDEIKTLGRLAVGGGAERYGFRPDLVVAAKAIASGFPLAVVGGRADVMEQARRTWISSTLATEFVSLAAARATLKVLERDRVPERLAETGAVLLEGLRRIHARFPDRVLGVGGVAPMCFLRFADDRLSGDVARRCAAAGVLFKRGAYNFVSLAHDRAVVERALGVVESAVAASV